MRRKCWFSLLLVPPPLEKICWFLFKSAQKKKISPFALSAPFVWNKLFDFLHDRRVFVIKFTHFKHFKHETVRSLLLLFLRRRIGAHSLSLSLSLFSSSSELLDLVKALFFHEATTRELYIFESLFYNGFDFTCVLVGQSSPQFCETTCRARASLLFTLLFSRDLIWSSIRSSIDRRLYSLIIFVVVKNWERAVVGVCVWNLNMTDESSSWKFRKKTRKQRKNEPKSRFYFKILWLLRRRNETKTV